MKFVFAAQFPPFYPQSDRGGMKPRDRDVVYIAVSRHMNSLAHAEPIRRLQMHSWSEDVCRIHEALTLFIH